MSKESLSSGKAVASSTMAALAVENQLQRLSDMTLVIEPTKTSAGTRKLPITEDVAKCFQAIIEDREKPKVEKVVD